MSLMKQCSYLFVVLLMVENSSSFNCTIPDVLRGAWFSWENEKNVMTNIDSTSATNRNECVDIKIKRDTYLIIFQKDDCHYCTKLIVRNVNVLEKLETQCLKITGVPSVENVCKHLHTNQKLITLFAEDYIPVDCKHSIEGVWNFVNEQPTEFPGKCHNPDARIISCKVRGPQFLSSNLKFDIKYRKCPDIKSTFFGEVQYACLGDWFANDRHYFAVANTRESRKNEKYRCFASHINNNTYLGASTTAECNTVSGVENSPERFQIIEVPAAIIEPTCSLPTIFSGDWRNLENEGDNIFINETHIIESTHDITGKYRNIINICKTQYETKTVMTQLTTNGCPEAYVCFNLISVNGTIKYEKGFPMVDSDFNKVCSWENQLNKDHLKDGWFIKKT